MLGQTIRAKGRSAWTWNTSASGGLAAGFVAASTGDIVLNDPQRGEHTFRYVAGGAGLGVGARRIPRLGRIDRYRLSDRGGANVALFDFTSHGTVYVMDGCPRDELTPEDFTGICVNYDASGSIIVGYTGTIFLINVDPLALAARATPATAVLAPPLKPHAMVLARGWNVGVQANAGVSAQLGYMWRPR